MVCSVPACSSAFELCESTKHKAASELYAQLLVLHALYHRLAQTTHSTLRKVAMMCAIPVELLLLLVRGLAPAHVFIVMFLGIRLIPSSSKWGWLVFRNAFYALFLFAAVVQVCALSVRRTC